MNPAFEKIIRDRGWDSPYADWMSSLQDAHQIMENIENAFPADCLREKPSP